MAFFQKRNGKYRVLFRYEGQQLNFSIGAVSQDEAQAKVGQVDLLLLRLSQRLAAIPAGMSIVEYLKFDGRPVAPEAAKDVKLSTLREKYLAANKASLEPTTVGCIGTHFRHLERVLGAGFIISRLKLADLQSYVNTRSKAKGKNGRTLSATTMHKEISTLNTAWQWAVKSDLVAGPFPSGLRYPRSTEKPPFMTRQEIERHISAGGLTQAEIVDLWHSLYLTVDELPKFLSHIKKRALQPFLYPAVCFVAHTGARRSEMLRARIADIDFTGKTIVIHEKKRTKGTNTTRRVPLTPFLEGVLKDWLAIHPGGAFLFSQDELPRQGIARRGKPQLNRGKAYDHLQRALAGSKWAVVAGYHVCRHSYCSALAASGVDQRIIDEIMGHQTEAMRKRYRHLTPNLKREAVVGVFS
jgi:integrase